MWQFVLLLIALLLWAISLFLVGEAAKSQRWALGGPEGMPEPYSGVAMSQLLSCLFIVLWIARSYLSIRPAQDPLYFISQLLVRPEQLTPGFLLGVFPPLIVGVVKLITALVVSRGELETAHGAGLTLLDRQLLDELIEHRDHPRDRLHVVGQRLVEERRGKGHVDGQRAARQGEGIGPRGEDRQSRDQSARGEKKSLHH